MGPSINSVGSIDGRVSDSLMFAYKRERGGSKKTYLNNFQNLIYSF